MSSKIVPVEVVRTEKAYSVPRHQAPMDLMLDGNEGKAPEASFLRHFEECDTQHLFRYPKANALEAELADYWKLPPEQVLVTAGADDGIDRICRTMLSDGREALMPWPTFVMLARYASVAGGKVVRVPWAPGTPFPVEAFLEQASEKTGVMMLVNPNNPTGTTIPFETIKQISEAVPHAILLLDGAYAEFADEDITHQALSLPNVAITRTFSKAWGLAGLRVGYVLSSPQIIQWLRVAGEPYAVSGVSIFMARKRLQESREEVETFIDEIKQARKKLIPALEEDALEVLPSQSNFLFAKVPDALWMRDAMAGLGIGIRFFPSLPELDGWVRVTCPAGEVEQKRLLHTWRSALKPEAILFDMDGVLADVSSSYRQAIVETVVAFGGATDFEEIDRYKAAGNANNDWELSQKILRDQGKEIVLQEVIDTFETLYQGTETQKGLREKESLLWSRDKLLALRERYPLAIVTGRPRFDALTFLRRFDLEALFDAIIVMEDGPAKPDPAPVTEALERLGVERAWMIGDTPDDIRAARRAGVVPVGVLLAHQQAEARDVLIRAGAARVLSDLDELEALLR